MGFDIFKAFTISSILSGCGESDLLSDRTLMKNSRVYRSLCVRIYWKIRDH